MRESQIRILDLYHRLDDKALWFFTSRRKFTGAFLMGVLFGTMGFVSNILTDVILGALFGNLLLPSDFFSAIVMFGFWFAFVVSVLLCMEKTTAGLVLFDFEDVLMCMN